MSTIDSRDLIEELEDEELDPARRAAIEALEDEVGSEWHYGAFLIPEDEFEDHARELAEEIGAIPQEYTWPTSCIDWERAARELRMDYSSVEFDGVTYLVRT